MFRPSIAFLHQIFKRKAKTKNNKNKNERRSNTTTVVMPATTAATTTTAGGSHILPASSECYDRGKVWRSWSLVHPSCSSSEKGEEEESGEEQTSPRAQSAQCAANKNKNKVPQSREAWWMDPALLQVRRRCSGSTVAGVVEGSSRRGRVVQGEGVWWTEQR